MIGKLSLNNIIYIAITCLVGTIIYLPSIRMHFDLQTLAVIGILYGMMYFRRVNDVLKSIIWPMVGFGLMNFFFALPGEIKMGFFHPIMSLWIWIFPMILALEMIRRGNMLLIKTTLLYNIIIWGVIVSATLVMMESNPIIMRALTSGTDEKLVLESQQGNVGGFFIAYGSGALFLISVAILLILKPTGLNMIFVISIMIASCILVIQAQFTTLLILCCGGLVILIWKNTQSPTTKILLTVGVTGLIYSFKYILLFAIDFYNGTATSEHLIEIFNTLYEGKEFDNARNTYLMDAVNLFFTSPIWGHDILHNADISAISRHCHSTFFLNATRTGILGVICFYATLWNGFKFIYSYFRNLKKKLFTVPILYTFALSILNPIEGDTFSYTVGFVLPIYAYYIYESGKSRTIKTMA